MILAVYGAGGLGREILELAEDVNWPVKKFERFIFIDDYNFGRTINGAPVFSFEEMQEKYVYQPLKIVIAVGEPYARKMLRDKTLAAGFSLETLTHPRSLISPDAVLGAGCLVCFGAFVSTGVELKENVLLQPNCMLGHDTNIGAHSVISPSANIGGGCVVGSETYIGMGAPVMQGVTIGARTIVGMGSVVTKDIPDDVIAFGNPARFMKNNESHKVFG
ncbi:MAG: acetyltransferase [Clostridiales Family XIII bacterium]|jgi:sugar O-acyltransferase (sialic acid O-acetyltransferase NeuD family)|nr:acetyltransferase [Clostridiales Family XIII bacterium]